MLNLVIKDILIQKKSLLYAFLYTIFLSFSFSSLKPVGLGLYVLCPLAASYLLTYNAVNYDDKNKSEIILNSLPIKREEIVIAKYISAIMYAVIGIIYSIVIGLIGNAAGFSIYAMSISLWNIILAFTSVCIFGALFLPVYFKYGAIRARVFNIILFMVIFFLPVATINYVSKNPNNILVQKFNYFINNTSSLMLNSLPLIIGIIIFLASTMISIRIYNNKEF